MSVPNQAGVLKGMPSSPGLRVGTIVQWQRSTPAVDEQPQGDAAHERARLDEAVITATRQLDELRQQMIDESDPSRAHIFVAHGEIVSDRAMLRLARKKIDAGMSAPAAWQHAYTTWAGKLAAMQNELFADRAIDVRDVGERVLAALAGHVHDHVELPDNAIVVARELTPSDTALIDAGALAGFVSVTGGASSHVAIIARSLDVPAITGMDEACLELADGELAVLDGFAGTLATGLSDAELQDVLARQAQLDADRAVDLSRAHETATTTDGHMVEVVANIADADDARQSLTVGAEGVGLLRSEFIFLDRKNAPDEDDQAEIYREIAATFTPHQRLVVRTLDVGGDKPLPYLPLAAEDNPFLGIRGVRVAMDRPDVLRTQMRAILRAVDAGAELHVMFPMIATLDDFRAVKRLFESERTRMGVAPVPLGVMVEVPSVAIMAEQFAREVDFFSIGTNDLTSYTLAMDRGHAKLAAMLDPCNPAILALVKMTADAAHRHGKWVGVCGAMASDPQAAPLLVGLGVDELSCAIPAIPSIKAQIRSWSLSECRGLADRALGAATATEVRSMVQIRA